MLLRSSGLIERECRHGIGHPDPDSVAYFRINDPEGWALATHGCDGCCKEQEPKAKDFEAAYQRLTRIEQELR